MSFGFAVGDFITVGKLIKETVNCLRSVGGAESEYQELVKDLKALDTSLHHLDPIDDDTNASAHVGPIQIAITNCRLRLERFLLRVKRYESSLGSVSHASTLRATSDKLGWHFGRKDQIEQLRRDIHICHSIISLHLAQYSLERLEILRGTTEIDFSHTSEQLHHAQTALEHINKDNMSQTVVLRDVHTLLQDIHQFVFGDIKSYLIRLLQLISSTFTSTQQIYEILLDIRNMISLDTRWTFFQAPLEVEDAFGVKFPIPTEYDYDLIDYVIRHRFQSGTGSMEVKVGNYELWRKRNRFDIVTETSRLEPGTAITMFLIVSTRVTKETVLPIPHCDAAEVIPCPGSGSVRPNRVIELYRASDMLIDIESLSGDSANSFPLVQPPRTRDQPANMVCYDITCTERYRQRNIRYDSSGNYSHAYSPVFEDIANIDGVVSFLSVSIDGLADGRFHATIELDLEQDCKDKSPRHIEVGRQLRKCLGRYGVQCHVAGKHVDAGA